jgi:hypothetical protein
MPVGLSKAEEPKTDKNERNSRSRPRCGRNLARRNFRQHDYIVLSCEFNSLLSG